jgi:hypothetical protein
MKTTANIAQMLVRGLGVILILLGITFWSGHALNLVNLHMAIGVLFVLSLWVLAGLAGAVHLPIRLVLLGVLWGVVVLWLGMVQRTMLVGSMHWIIRVLHLLVGLAAMGVGDSIGRRVKMTLDA